MLGPELDSCASGPLDIEPSVPPPPSCAWWSRSGGSGSGPLGGSHGSEAVIPLPGIERGAQAGIEPAKAALMTQQIDSAEAGQIMSTQLHL